MDGHKWEAGRELIGRFLDEIDNDISVRLQRDAVPLETTLTQEFLARLDPNACRRERPDAYASFCADLRQSLTEAGLTSGDNVQPWTAEITTIPHPSGYEAFVSHSDMGLIIDYAPAAGQLKLPASAYLLQAKKLYPARDVDGIPFFHGHCRFEAFEKEQHDALVGLQAELESGALRYLYFMPRRGVFQWFEAAPRRIAPSTRDRIQARHDSDACDDGIWIGDVHPEMIPKRAVDVHRLNGSGTSTFSAFILDNMGRAGVFGGAAVPDPLRMEQRHASSLGAHGSLAYGLAVGDEAVAKYVVQRLRSASVTVPILPAATMTLTIPPAPAPMPSSSPAPAPRSF